ncbi:hypothetical protein M2451_001176 [Dysgonomonas sp. PFB1-18]|uniref:hypothetical protein n=1 Tax=unclassified Dysgonomonas TaxID=2630389 RepID=UPI0024758996|nr:MULTISPECIES: hypothetical protein [unclassified Dysgonomonas]MDH6308199.1 hypothetical protein [Dysgonomonas sp. PF1-14]MDH6338362.1 hypothetical protein [Dysgonomonas sp. PF1-16]MDH6379859.1 hypothetical protein [Dysgonomonas sp. PFB1-18]MDH6397051.1 hypothetical protein [Dysgonomonas sp. PF1-23]
MNKIFRKQNLLYIFLLVTVAIFTQCGGSVDSQLEKLAKESNERGPRMLDQWTRLDRCEAVKGKSIRYYHTVSGIEVTDTTLFKTNLKPQIVRTTKTSPDSRFFRDNEVSMQYIYNDSNGKYLFSVLVAPEDYKN